MNQLVKDLQNSFITSLKKTANVLNISDTETEKSILSINDCVEKAFKSLDQACTEFGKLLLQQHQNKEKEPEGLTLLFSGKYGGKIYCTGNLNAKLVINDESLVVKDLNALNKSFYAEDYLEASKFLKLIRERGFITLKEYKK